MHGRGPFDGTSRQIRIGSQGPSPSLVAPDGRPVREVRAQFDDDSVIVYQAYASRIADPALLAQRFVSPFQLDRMTWIKPSFLWMMYRSGWAAKPGQERVLAVRVTRSGFDWALEHSCLTAYHPGIHESEESWAASLAESPVRVQWDPERSVSLTPLGYRTIQIGLAGAASRRYVDEWVISITDVTEHAKTVARLVRSGRLAEASASVPIEREYPVSSLAAERIGSA